MMESKKTGKSYDVDDNLIDRLNNLGVGSALQTGISGETTGLNGTDIILAVGLTYRYPTAAFIAPCLGFFKCTNLPVLTGLSQSKKAYFVSSKHDPEDLKFGQFSPKWTKNFLSHCKSVLQLKLGKSMDFLRLQVSFTTRKDTSDLDKLLLAKAAEETQFSTHTTRVQIIPIIEAVTIEAIWKCLASGAPKFKNGDNILALHDDGEVIDIQSYSISLPATVEGSNKFQFQMTEMACGETLNWGKLVDQQFTQWMQNKFGNSFLQLSEKDTGPNSRLMLEFAKVRRGYQTQSGGVYNFPLTLRQPPDHAPYDSDCHICQVQDSQMEMFFRSAADSLYRSLTKHHNRVSNNSIRINKIFLFAPPDNSRYMEQQLLEWGSSWTDILPRITLVSSTGRAAGFAARLRAYFRVESR
jgi:hypothetical protein